ncbi:hypothetical protein [Capnocytophaga felis]|uniref:Uncharacterized protein n=1 Tax=Capnocytophaga felis TaxID=2267611 RepID=A0A5M4BAH1_9FLAO|nr:hypothetical protein [Capnocytophaga felis]GET46598.1 hypothetical protein RCZ01_19000 [Capnocytophaga felis]GET49072.1 hypothetical protein RCZ02_19030 [Capnocytophaga felis]
MIKLTEKQKGRLRILEPKLNKAIDSKQFEEAKKIVLDLQYLLRPSGHFVRLIQSKNKLYELAIEQSKYDVALQGLLANQKVLNNNTRIYLETISLIAICYLRMRDIINAKIYIKEVLENDTVIKTQRTRSIFHSEIINRFNEEVALVTLINSGTDDINEEEIEKEVIRIIQTLSDDEIFASMGEKTPNSTKDLIYLIHDYSLKQLPYKEKLSLPSPEQKIKDKEVGITIFESVKRVIYNSLCSQESEIYKIWYTNGMSVVLGKKYIISTVVSILMNMGIGIKMLIASIIALITKFGIEVYCEKYKPIYVSEIRNK